MQRTSEAFFIIVLHLSESNQGTENQFHYYWEQKYLDLRSRHKAAVTPKTANSRLNFLLPAADAAWPRY
jgi:hypothetical protein